MAGLSADLRIPADAPDATPSAVDNDVSSAAPFIIAGPHAAATNVHRRRRCPSSQLSQSKRPARRATGLSVGDESQPSGDPPACVAWPFIDTACIVNVSAESCASRDTVINDAADATSAHPSSSTTSAPSAMVNLPPTPNASTSTTSSAHLCAGLIPADSATAQVVKPPKPSVSPTYPPNIPGPADHMFSPTTPTTLGSLRRTILNGERATIPSSGRSLPQFQSLQVVSR